MTPKEMDYLTKKRDEFERWITDNGNYPHLAHKTQHGMYLNEHTIYSWEGFRKGYDAGVEASEKEILFLKDALRMIIYDIKTPDEMLQKGYACNLTSTQQHGIVKARSLLKDNP